MAQRIDPAIWGRGRSLDITVIALNDEIAGHGFATKIAGNGLHLNLRHFRNWPLAYILRAQLHVRYRRQTGQWSLY